MTHPNAFAVVVTTLIAALALHVAHAFGYADLTDEQAIGLAGGVITAVIFLGRRIWTVGLKGLAKTILNGTRAVVAGTSGTDTGSKKS